LLGCSVERLTIDFSRASFVPEEADIKNCLFYTPKYIQCADFISQNSHYPRHLLRPNMLQLLWLMQEVVGICLWQNPPLIWLLNIVLISLLVGESNGILLCLESDAFSLHSVCRGLPAHERILPSMALGEWVPVDLPSVRVPCT
jgi:hypothetical protein